MESILYRNKRNTYSVDNSVIKAAVNEGKHASAYIERIMCSRDGRLFEKVPNEYRYTCNGEVIERGVKEDLQVCIKNLNEAITEYADEHGAARKERNEDAHKPQPAGAIPTAQAADFTAAGQGTTVRADMVLWQWQTKRLPQSLRST